MNHTEPDHSGSLEKLLELNPGLTVAAHPTALGFLREICPVSFNSHPIKNYDELDLGGKTLQFITAMMLHWPDTIYTYIKEDKVLMSCDSFGSHFADERLFNDLITTDFSSDFRYYFDSIISPFKSYVLKALNKLKHYDIDIICPGHGPILRSNVNHYIDLYRTWAAAVPNKLPKIVIAYVSAYGFTEALADEIERGIINGGLFEVGKYDLVNNPAGKVLEEIENADAIVIGSPTINKDAPPPVWNLLIHLSPISHAGKIAAAFGSYGWSGEAVPNIEKRLHMLRMKILPGLKVKLKPNDADLNRAYQLGQNIALVIMNKDNEEYESYFCENSGENKIDYGIDDYKKQYENQDVIVHWNPDLCYHDTYCFTHLPQVFNPDARPWVKPDGAAAEAIIRAINKCPSGALRYSIPAGSSVDPKMAVGPGLLK